MHLISSVARGRRLIDNCSALFFSTVGPALSGIQNENGKVLSEPRCATTAPQQTRFLKPHLCDKGHSLRQSRLVVSEDEARPHVPESSSSCARLGLSHSSPAGKLGKRVVKKVQALGLARKSSAIHFSDSRDGRRFREP